MSALLLEIQRKILFAKFEENTVGHPHIEQKLKL